MKRYLTATFLVLSVIILIFGFQTDVRWNGIATWGLTFICLLFAAYFTRYIPDKRKKEK